MGCTCSDRNFGDSRDTEEVLISDLVSKQIEENPLLIYSISNCNKSKSAKNLMRKDGLDFEYFDLDKMEDKKFLHALEKITNHRNPPYIFVKGIYIGGLDELEEMLKDNSSRIAN
jgi:glutaredoxin 3